MKKLKALITGLIALAIIVIAVLFTVHNETPVSVDLVFMTLPEASLAVWLTIVFVLGAVIGVLISSSTILVLRTRLKRAEKKLAREKAETAKKPAAPEASS